MANYSIEPPENGFRSADSFSPEEAKKLLPICETLAMLDGNAFFGMTNNWALQYLPEAAALYEMNGGDNGWAGRASFVHPTP